MKINVERTDIKSWLDTLKSASRDNHYAALYKRLHKMVAVPKRRRVSVNVYKINKYSKDGDNVIVPGKVLSIGKLDHKVNIAAIEFSQGAMMRIKESNSKVMKLEDIIKLNKINVIR